VIDLSAVQGDIGAVIDSTIHKQSNALGPCIHLVGPVRVCLVARLTGKSCCQLEELAVRETVLVVVAVVEGEDLPS
jgi:hypothetical protein